MTDGRMSKGETGAERGAGEKGGRGERGRGGVLRLEGTDGLKKRGKGGGQGPDGLEMKRRDEGRAPFQVCPFSARVSFWPEGGGHSESPKARRGLGDTSRKMFQWGETY